MKNWNIDKMKGADKNSNGVQLFKAENEYAAWKSDVTSGLCRDDAKIHADFKAKIAELNKKING